MDNFTLVIPLEGKIDSVNAAEVGRNIAKKRAAQEHQAVIFDAKKLTFISSAGLRVIMQVVKEEKVQKHEQSSCIGRRRRTRYSSCMLC